MHPNPLILAIGDSLVAGYGLPAADAFPAQLERCLRPAHPNVRVINAGRSGDTAAGVLRRLPAALSALAARPDLAIVQVGPNDALRQVPPSAVQSSLDAVLTELGRCGVPALLTTVAPPAILQDRIRPYLAIHDQLARRYEAAVAPFFPAGILGRPDMVLADRMHPNAAAIALVADALAPVVERLLAHRAAA